MQNHEIESQVQALKKAGVIAEKDIDKARTVIQEVWANKICLIWAVEDVLWRAREIGKKITEEDALNILNTALDKHDANYGVCWEAMKVLDEVFEPSDVLWRGFPVIKGSGLSIRKRFETHDARSRYSDLLAPVHEKEFSEVKGCRCGEMLRGILTSEECPLFATGCTPANPLGPCMVSKEGSCYISYRYRKKQAAK